MKSSGRFFIRILTSDPPILLSKNIHAEVNKSCAQIEEEKKKGGSTIIRIRTLDLETSPSALPAGQRKKKSGSTPVREDSNLTEFNISTKCFYSWVKGRTFELTYVRIQTSDFARSVSNALPAELRENCGSTFVWNYMLTVRNYNFWLTSVRILTSDLPIMLSDTQPS